MTRIVGVVTRFNDGVMFRYYGDGFYERLPEDYDGPVDIESSEPSPSETRPDEVPVF